MIQSGGLQLGIGSRIPWYNIPSDDVRCWAQGVGGIGFRVRIGRAQGQEA